MDSKAKHRILGILVVAGLIVIALPFMQHNKEMPTDMMTAKEPPPFPDQSVQVTTTTPPNEMKQQPDDTINQDAVPAPNASIAPPPVIASPVTPPTANTNEEVPAVNNSDADTAPTELDIPKNGKVNQLIPHDEEEASSIKEPQTAKIAAKKSSVTKMKLAKAKSKHTAYNKHAPLDNNGLFKLHNAGWVIEVGSYKNKANALRLVNHLRGNGYRAFIQQVSTSHGNHIQVFIGPETKQTVARTLASELEHDLHVRGMVISYKPLAL